MHLIAAFFIAFATYSRLPVPNVEWRDENRKYVFCFFPLIGAVIGLCMFIWYKLCTLLPVSPLLRGAVGAAIPLWITGGIHLDGFMDTCDALASWQSPEKRLLILKDSHVGAFSVMGCVLYLILMTALLAECTVVQAYALATCFVLSRALSALLSVSMKQARTDGMLSGFTGAAAPNTVRFFSLIYIFLCTLILLLTLGLPAFFTIGAIVLTVIVYTRMAMKAFGGVTGDLAGWFLQVAELAAIAGIVMGGLFS